MKKAVKKVHTGSRYIRQSETIFWRTHVDYTEKDKKKIAAYFPKENRKSALEETTHHVSTLISCLLLKTTPRNIKRRESAQQIKELHACLMTLEKQLRPFLQQSWHQNTIKLKRAFYKLIHPEYSRITLQAVSEIISYLKLAAEQIRKNPGTRGVKNPFHHEAISNLASIWEKYSGKNLGRSTKFYELPGGKTSQKDCGKFLEYVSVSINSASYIMYFKKKKHKTKISSDRSLPNIVRDVLKYRKKHMAETSKK